MNNLLLENVTDEEVEIIMKELLKKKERDNEIEEANKALKEIIALLDYIHDLHCDVRVDEYVPRRIYGSSLIIKHW